MLYAGLTIALDGLLDFPMGKYCKKFLAILLLICISTHSFADGEWSSISNFRRHPSYTAMTQNLADMWKSGSNTSSHLMDVMSIVRPILEPYSVFVAREKLTELTNKTAKELKTAGQAVSNTVVGHTASTVLMISIVGIYAGIAERMRADKTYDLDKLTNDKELWDQIQIVMTSGSLWSGILGSTGGSLAIQHTTKLYSRLLAQPASSSVFKRLVGSCAMTLATFTIWEGGGEIWEEARRLLTDPHEYELSENFFSVVGGFLGMRSGVPLADYQMHSVGKKMFKNMFLILSNDQGLLNKWLYNTYRFRIMTGEFAAMVAAMWVGGQLGSLVPFPGSGLVFGIVFGIVTYYLPYPWKDGITVALKEFRKWAGRVDLRDNLYSFEVSTLYALAPSDIVMAEWKAAKLMGEIPKHEEYPLYNPMTRGMIRGLSVRSSWREKYVGMIFEFFTWYYMQRKRYDYEVMLNQNELKSLKDQITKEGYDVEKEIAGIKEDIKEASAEMSKLADELEMFYENEWNNLKKIADALSDHAGEDTDLGCIERAVQDQMAMVSIIHSNITSRYAKTLKRFIVHGDLEEKDIIQIQAPSDWDGDLQAEDGMIEDSNGNLLFTDYETFKKEQEIQLQYLMGYNLDGFNEAAKAKEVVDISVLMFFGADALEEVEKSEEKKSISWLSELVLSSQRQYEMNLPDSDFCSKRILDILPTKYRKRVPFNPSRHINLSDVQFEKKPIITYKLYDISGNVVGTKTEAFTKLPLKSFNWASPGIKPGIHMLEIKTSMGETAWKKILFTDEGEYINLSDVQLEWEPSITYTFTDVSGNVVSTLVKDYKQQPESFDWSPMGIEPGVYILEIRTSFGEAVTKKIFWD